MSSVLDVSSLYDSYASRISSASAAGTSDKIGGIGKDSSDEELMEACKSFESYFVQKMIEEAKKTVFQLIFFSIGHCDGLTLEVYTV